ncbi:MAG: carboxyltransferase domain-containing protein [Gammaproteobacteria bacterium]|nr:carboxyltransferase domain-containing protein [Gammaproteobacteria bacterium]
MSQNIDYTLAELGSCAITATFADQISPDITALVRGLDLAIAHSPMPGLVEVVPCYTSVTMHFSKHLPPRHYIESWLQSLLAALDGSERLAKRWRVPACYHPDIAEDLFDAATALGVSIDVLVEAHTAATFEIAMYGFAPGWAYLSGTPSTLDLPRRLTPRGPTPADALLIAGGQAMLAANPMPTGWYVIGRSAQPSFFLDRTPPVVFDVGDQLSFYAVEPAQWQAMYAAAKAGELIAERVH